jgi:peptidoglycan hydrolase CwlO-like protein
LQAQLQSAHAQLEKGQQQKEHLHAQLQKQSLTVRELEAEMNRLLQELGRAQTLLRSNEESFAKEVRALQEKERERERRETHMRRKVQVLNSH